MQDKDICILVIPKNFFHKDSLIMNVIVDSETEIISNWCFLAV